MKSIVIIILYFGRLPKWFNQWALTCKHNSSIDFILFTDDSREQDYPPNCTVKIISFLDMKKRIQGKFDFLISLETPYKLCDYKCAYGDVFRDEISGYDFWGYCDLDIVMGDLRAFLTVERLCAAERIYRFGHLSIYKNSEKMICLYKKSGWKYSYKEIYSSPYIYAFDEQGMEFLCGKYRINYFKEVECADLDTKKNYVRLEPNYAFIKNRRDIAFYFEEGKTYACYAIEGRVNSIEVAYIHFKKRNMFYVNNAKESFYVGCNGFISKKSAGSPKIGDIKQVNPYPGEINMFAWMLYKNAYIGIYLRVKNKMEKIIYNIIRNGKISE